MAGIGLKEDLLEMEGLDLGKSRAPRPYLDSSHTPARSGHFHHTQDASQGHDHQYVPITAAPPLTATGDAVVDRWLRALQTGDLAAARKVENEFAASAEGQWQWETGLAAAHAEQDRQQPWRAQARDTPLYQQALQQLDAQPGQFWMHEQRENLAGALALQAQRAGLPRINALFAGENGVQPVFQHPHNHYANRYGAAADPQQAAEQPLQHSMRQLGEEAAQQAQQALLEEQRQQQRGRSL
ncbi:XVIPCD domain-containing protein [Pseudoxanthomonas dokdonensis]|uniref:XVIPCD domain-containing protein n=1 Tax=Pseudoxanthomonas dokdonensis TaxID=344882 RepID=UPI00070AD512|nr:XVIPCD domain-containing protein [Pseudoxanthomonas dokdonensis]